MSEQQDLETQAKQLGERIGFLLAASSLPDDVKEALIVMLPEFTPEQVDALVHMLEQSVAGTAEAEAQQFIENLQAVKEAHDAQAKAAEQHALSELAEIERLLDQSES